MSRETKFRVWNEREKTYEDGWDYFISDDGQIYALKYGALVNMSGVDYLKVEYSTGLKDKNGREIYDGDVVNKGYLNYDVFDEIGVVGLGILSDSDGFSHCKILGWKAGDNSLLDVCAKCEVIGNLHTNPELLEKKKLKNSKGESRND